MTRSSTRGPRPIVLAVIATDRVAALRRLFRSLDPVRHDARLHVVVLDNGPVGLAGLVEHEGRFAAGHRICGLASAPRLPLHRARVALTQLVVANREVLGPRPIVWMLDDDLTFEALGVYAGRLVRRNVASQRVWEVRRLAETLGCDLLVGGFTGDPPVRPDAVQATQLRDLAASLESFARLAPETEHHVESPVARSNDDYYDHAEGRVAHLELRHPWLVRGDAGATTGAQFVRLCEEASKIPSGATPFRPMLETVEFPAVRTTTPRRGGNAIFFDWHAFVTHLYPAIRLEEGWSRRSDMIGATLLARRGAKVFEGGPTLLHDRTGQSPARFEPAALKPEFAGVLLSRLVNGELSASNRTSALLAYARARAQRIVSMQEAARFAGRAALQLLGQSEVWWRFDPVHREAAAALAGSVAEGLDSLSTQRLEDVRGALEDRRLLARIERRAQALVAAGEGVAAGEEASCAGG